MSSSKVTDTIEYSVLRLEHVEEAACVLSKAFLEGERLNLALKMPYETQLEKNQMLCQLALADEVSCVAIDSKSGNVVGAAIGVVVTGEDHLKDAKSRDIAVANPDSCPFARRIQPFLRELNKFYYRHPKLCDSNLDKNCKILKNFKIGVLPAYYGRGIGKKLAITQNDFAKQKGCEFVFLTSTSPGSEKLYLKLGYEVIGEVCYADFEVEGEKPFACITNPSSAKAMFKTL
ncbi:uncharacterized protein LOC144436926 [Glandiceps talaboti]